MREELPLGRWPHGGPHLLVVHRTTFSPQALLLKALFAIIDSSYGGFMSLGLILIQHPELIIIYPPSEEAPPPGTPEASD